MTVDEMGPFAARLMRSLQDGDFETTVGCFEPDATWWMNGKLRGRFEEILPEMKATKASRGVNPHLEIRRMYSEGGFTDQHVVRLPREGKAPVDLAVCVVVRVGEDGRASRFEEYFDSAALTA
jgi:ketosteroid isomerase-like protein